MSLCNIAVVEEFWLHFKSLILQLSDATVPFPVKKEPEQKPWQTKAIKKEQHFKILAWRTYCDSGTNEALMVYNRQKPCCFPSTKAAPSSWRKFSSKGCVQFRANADSKIKFPHFRMLMAISLLSPPTNVSFWQKLLGPPLDIIKEGILTFLQRSSINGQPVDCP